MHYPKVSELRFMLETLGGHTASPDFQVICAASKGVLRAQGG